MSGDDDGVGAQFENSSEIGVFARLTNSYCLVSRGMYRRHRHHTVFCHVRWLNGILQRI